MPVLLVYVWHRESSLQLNRFVLYCELRRIREGKDYHAIDLLISIGYGYIDRVTGYKTSPKMPKVHTMYSSLIKRDEYGNWKRGATNKDLKAIGADGCEFKKEVVEMVSSVCT